ncbi:E1 [Human papillomavirus type 190]|uniref:Replication protein E1 n=1 Tax=Human papillomavirus TaxID=10566 RepID=A0A385PLG7_9PAPI|nr:E1 [Human papillomavirus type 190]AYA94468.1 MAG: E1 protein [Human papillomavirus]
MGDPTKGTDSLDCLEGASSWYFVSEADCVDDINDIEELFDKSTDSSVSNLIDDSDEVDQGNTLSVYNEQLQHDCDQAILLLKRKYTNSPDTAVAALSPKLQAVSLSPQKDKQSKRRLIFEDSGIEQDEAANSLTSQVDNLIDSHVENPDQEGSNANEVLERSNQKAYLLFKFKDTFGVPYTELIRNYKSDRSCNDNWIVAVFKVAEEVLEASKIIIQKHCDSVQVILRQFNGLYAIQFKTAKNRDTVMKLFCCMLNVQTFQILCDPPKTRSMAAALYFFKQSMIDNSYVFGGLPDWIRRHTVVDHQIAASADTFELSALVQWGYDNDITDEAQMAYDYAQLADTDSNAAALLKHNNQVKFIKDACTMVRLYKRHEMKRMTMAEWVNMCCEKCGETNGDWKTIIQYLKYQHINILDFLYVFKLFLKSTPKKNCLVIYGPSDTGKSFFAYSLIGFLRGRVISQMNKQSQFWLQPLAEAKIGLLDDATYDCWKFIDMHMRTALDGNMVSVDYKHRAPLQMKLPPLIITTNYYVKEDQALMYLHSRVHCLHFPNKMPLTEAGKPLYEINDCAWKLFFRKLANQLDLTVPEKEDGVADTAFQCCPRSSLEPN